MEQRVKEHTDQNALISRNKKGLENKKKLDGVGPADNRPSID